MSATPAQLLVDERGARTMPPGPLAASAGWDLGRGVGCFTTGRVLAGELTWRDAHRARILDDALALSPDLASVTAALAAVERATDHVLGSLDGRRTLRWGLFLDDERGWRWALTLEPERRAWCDPDRRFTLAAVERGVRWEAKTLDRAAQRQLEAEAAGADGVVLMRDGRLSEGTWFNIAVVTEGGWVVPGGVFPGLTRQRLLDVLAAEGAAITHEDVDPDALSSADAVIALSAVAGVGMVGAVGTWTCGATTAGAALLARIGSAL